MNQKPVKPRPIVEQEKKITSRDKALLYAKQVPKPKSIQRELPWNSPEYIIPETDRMKQ